MPNNFKKLRLGTRGSALALVQAEAIATLLEKKYPQTAIEMVTIQTSGDRFTGERLAEAGGKALFAKEIEEALITEDIDFAVHSLKDLPGILPDELRLACFPKREDPRDCFISFKFQSFENLPNGSKIGTGSPRRAAQIFSLRPDLKVEPIRGNIDTRLKKMAEGDFDAIILAAAGLHRLQKKEMIREYFSPDTFVPAVGQGILGIEVRKKDRELSVFLSRVLDDPQTSLAARAERAFLQAIGGDCTTPLGGHAWVEGNTLKMIGWLASPDGKKSVRCEKKSGLGVVRGSDKTLPLTLASVGFTPRERIDRPEKLGRELAQEILNAFALNQKA